MSTVAPVATPIGAPPRAETPPRPLRMAWLAPMPVDAGGVSGVVWDLLAGLPEGVQVELFAQTTPTGPQSRAAAGLASVTVHSTATRWSWGRWYSRDPLLAFLTGLAARTTTMRRAWVGLAAAHRRDTFDVIFQVSAIELLGVRRLPRPRPPIVVQPETHMAGELRALRAERALARRCIPWWRTVVTRALLAGRSRRQRRDLRHAAMVVAISTDFGQQVAADNDYPLTQVVTVPNPVDCDYFQPAARAGGHTERVLFAGRISTRKGIDVLLAVARRLERLRPGAEVVIVGGGSLWSDYRGLLEDLPANTTYRGAIAREELRTELQQADVVLQPSTYEPFALTAAEALACGTPVVSTDVVGATEGAPTVACRRVPVNDAAAMAAATCALLDDTSTAAGEDHVRAAARAHAVATFDRRLVAAAVVDALSSVVVR